MQTPAHNRITRFTALFTVAAFIVGCGGGGGGAPSVPSPQPTPPSQPTPPTPPLPPPPPPPPPAPQLSLLTGNVGGAGNLDGSVDIARFDSPNSVVADADGNRYVADTQNHVIRKISADGTTVTTFVGRIGEAGDTDAFGAEARFRSPAGLAIDSLFLYVADTGNRMVRRIRLVNADVRTVAGNPEGGTVAVDGTVGRNGTARFNLPVALAVGPTSLGAPLFVADQGAHAIRMVIGGTVSTIAGTLNAPNCSTTPVPTAPIAGNAGLCLPSGLALRNADGRLYFTESSRSRVRAVAPSDLGFAAAAQNSIEFVAGSPSGVEGNQDGVGSAATFNSPDGIATTGDGELIVGQRAALRRIRISSEGARVDSLAGSLSGQVGNIDGVRSEARFGTSLAGVAIDASAGVLIADSTNHLIRTFDLGPRRVGTLAGQREARGNDDGSTTDARFSTPHGISIAGDGSATLVDAGSEQTRRIDITAGQVTTLSEGDVTVVEMRPVGVVAADAGRPAAIVGTSDSTVRVIENGVARVLAGSGVTDGEGFSDGPGTLARFQHPQAIVRDAQGLLWIADQDNDRIRTVAADGTTSTFAGSEPGHVDGAIELARFDKPIGVALAANGELFVLEAGNKAIRRISKDAQGRDTVSTVAQGLVDPVGLAIDAADNLYVIDATEQTVRRFRPGASQGEVIVGTANQCGFVSGALPGVICRPRGIAVRDGRLLVTMDQGVVMVEPLAP